MLAASHVVAGAAVGLVLERPVARTLGALATHLVLDGVGHDDDTIGVRAQAALATIALGALGVCWGPASPVVLGGLAGVLPDAEVAVDLVLLGGVGRYVFPSHWQLGRRPRATGHPYRFPGTRVSVATEIAAGACALAALCALGLRRSRAASAPS